MTYFGVNYYLSGMHSYASGDSASVPSFVYIIVLVLAALSFVAYSKYKTGKKTEDIKKNVQTGLRPVSTLYSRVYISPVLYYFWGGRWDSHLPLLTSLTI